MTTLPEVRTRIELYGDCQVPVHVPVDPVEGQLRLLNSERAELDRRIQTDATSRFWDAKKARAAYASAYDACASEARKYQRRVDAVDWCERDEDDARDAAQLMYNAADLEARFGATPDIIEQVQRLYEPFLRHDLQQITREASSGGAIAYTGLHDADAMKASGLDVLCSTHPDRFGGALELLFLKMRRALRDLGTAFDATTANAHNLVQVVNTRAEQLRSLRVELARAA
jgi:hypothetical protein